MNTRALLLGVALVAMSSTYILPASAVVIQPCGNSSVHTYDVTGSGGITINGSFGGGGFTSADDTCPLNTSNPDDGDFDYDAGIGGGIFYASSTCGPAPGTSAAPQTPGYSWSPHHAYAPGSAYTATNSLGSIAYTAGSDGGIQNITDNNNETACLGNNIVSDDPITDPYDCGQGQTGFANTPFDRPATIGPNNSTNDCDPADGYVAVFIAFGPIIPCDNTQTPSSACIQIRTGISTNPPGVTGTPQVWEGISGPITNGQAFISTPISGTITG